MIEFGFPQKDAYDFVIKNKRREKIKNDKKVVEKLKAVKYKNPEIGAMYNIWVSVQESQ